MLKQQIKTLHDFDLNNFQENIKSINTEINTQLQITMQKSLYDLRLSAKPWYESMASLLRTPDELNVNYSLQLVNNERPINEQLNIQITADKSNGTNVVDSVIN